jgi:VWFA-related protein
MGTNDIGAVVHTSGRRDASQEFTSSKNLLLAAVEQFHGRKLRSATLEKLDQSINMSLEELESLELYDPFERERTQRARSTLEILEKLSEGLADMHGRRKAVVYFGEGIDYNIYNVFEASEAGTIIDGTYRTIGEATRANVAIYTVDPRGLAFSSEDSAAVGGVPIDFADQMGRPSMESALLDEFRNSQDSLRELSEETGGFAVLNQNDFTPGLTRIVEENSHYYLLGYYPTNRERDGKFRKIEVRVKREYVEVRARKGYVAPEKGDERAETAHVDAPKGASEELSLLAQSPLPLPEIPMTATASPFRIAKNRAVVPLVVEMNIDGFRFEDKDGKFCDDVELSAIALDYKGKVRASVRREFNLSLRPKTYQLMTQAGFRVMTAMELPSGRYQLRIVVLEAGAGRGGSLFYDVEIPEYGKSDLVMTPLVVTSAIESSVPVIGSEEDKQTAILLPATRRAFAGQDRLVVLAEVYPRVRSGSRPPKVEITTTIKATDEQAVFTNTEERGGEELTGPGEGIIHKVEIPLSGLVPGDYLLEMKARHMAEEVVVTRQVLIEIL